MCAADDMEDMVHAVKHAIKQCCSQVQHILLRPLVDLTASSHKGPACAQLRTKIVRQLADKERLLRQKNLTKYIPDAASAIHKVLQVTV